MSIMVREAFLHHFFSQLKCLQFCVNVKPCSLGMAIVPPQVHGDCPVCYYITELIISIGGKGSHVAIGLVESAYSKTEN